MVEGKPKKRTFARKILNRYGKAKHKTRRRKTRKR
jgi:hypothetical protein